MGGTDETTTRITDQEVLLVSAIISLCSVTGFFQAQHMFSPRMGFAYQATNKTVIRGGYGMFFARPQGNMIFSQVNVPTQDLSQHYTCSVGSENAPLDFLAIEYDGR
jgi:hypothetical protein